MILHWQQMVLHYGGAVGVHRHRFERASQATYALLCCRFAPGEDRLVANAVDHAERRLLQSSLWRTEIPEAIAGSSSLDRNKIVVTMAVNRSPCPDCARRLTQSLIDLHHRFPKRMDHARFVLASRGAYQGRVTDAGYFGHATTTGDLRRLRDVGWEVCVLQLGGELSPSGQQLLEATERQAGIRGGILRLDS